MDNESYVGSCSVCGFHGSFVKNNPSFREGYQCPGCRSSLRYRGQASSIIKMFSPTDDIHLSELAELKEFAKLHIYEPGITGPFRSLFADFNHYRHSFYWDNIETGQSKDGVECQSLEALTFEDNKFDLILSSDIMEHVRKPWVAFEEIYRVLKPGGCHIFSIPIHLPLPAKTKYRVDTSTDTDVHIEEPHYHGNGMGGKSLVYTDFGADTTDRLISIGYNVTLDTIPHEHAEVKRLGTFITQKPF